MKYGEGELGKRNKIVERRRESDRTNQLKEYARGEGRQKGLDVGAVG